jgi:hypothetical protein
MCQPYVLLNHALHVQEIDLGAWVPPLLFRGDQEPELVAPEDTLKADEIPEGALTLPQSPGEKPQKCLAYTTHRDSATVVYCGQGQKLDPKTVPFPRANKWWEDFIAVSMMVSLFWCVVPVFASAFSSVNLYLLLVFQRTWTLTLTSILDY